VDGQLDDAGDKVVVEAHDGVTGDGQETVGRLMSEPVVEPDGQPVKLGDEVVMAGGGKLLTALANRNVEGRGDVGVEVGEVGGGSDGVLACWLGTVKVRIDGEGGTYHMAGEAADRERGKRARCIPSSRHFLRGDNRANGRQQLEQSATGRAQVRLQSRPPRPACAPSARWYDSTACAKYPTMRTGAIVLSNASMKACREVSSGSALDLGDGNDLRTRLGEWFTEPASVLCLDREAAVREKRGECVQVEETQAGTVHP
jgi:hypothetical protein